MKSISINGYHWALFSSLERAAKQYQHNWNEYQKVQTRDLIPRTSKVFKIPSGYSTAKYALEDARLKIYILSATCVEALINFYMSLKVNAEQFRKYEKRGIINKWINLPKQFLSGYELSKNSSLLKTLEELINKRNDIVHAKPHLVIDRQIIHEGKPPKYEEEKKVHDFTLVCVSLPLKLANHLKKYDKTETMDNVFYHSGVDPTYNFQSLINIEGEEKWLKEHEYKRSYN